MIQPQRLSMTTDENFRFGCVTRNDAKLKKSVHFRTRYVKLLDLKVRSVKRLLVKS